MKEQKMDHRTLDLTISIKGTEAQLNEIQQALTGPTSNRPALMETLAATIKQALTAAANISHDVEVELHDYHLSPPAQAGGGLDASEWLEKTTLSKPRTGPRFED
jgi:hypothetical protein